MFCNFFFLEEVAVSGEAFHFFCSGEGSDLEVLALSGSFDIMGTPELCSAFESSLADMITCEIDRYKEKRYDHRCT